MIYYLCKYLALFLLKVFCFFQVRGREYFPRRGPCFLISNHSSYLDPVVLGCAAPRRVYFVAKEELFRNPVVAFLLRQLGAFPLRRGEIDKEAVRTIFRLLREGKVVCFFPEGTRNDGTIKPFRKGALKLLLKSNVPVVVASIRGTYESFPRCRKFPRPFPIKVVFSSPFIPNSCSLEVLEDEIRRRMEVALHAS
ncbi:lysophospholipid acyltransferase family protein [Candidatus Caldatribacterium sp.]|uniref:lysophospholipid acyltransferase family protein n=1 Tax=Candidatus Caldatribacterium sp. TaxID=2282143 RepID=UPI0029921073|nr:1-acyl-sn-glycerol-3-phosphate acyltransferase [Candidatus Caldatribacterium sp.]MDW8081170.1 lysophospholipid acyltransferase family protein [Candidatus Calescibacterium sp.]